MNRRKLLVLGLAAGLAPSPLRAEGELTSDGAQILQRATAAPGLDGYTVPIRFDVHMSRPLGVRAAVGTSASYRTPAHAVLTLTNLPPILKGIFRSSYELDVVPQTWAAKYNVTDVATERVAGADVYVLGATPKVADVIDRVTFRIQRSDDAPVAADWHYRDGSTIRLSLVNRPVERYLLPARCTIVVAMPSYGLQADGTYGAYDFSRAPTPDGSSR